MAIVKEATPEMFPQVHELLLQFNLRNPQITRHDWEMIFKHPWQKNGDPIGYVLIDNDEIVGFLGTLCSHRVIRGKPHKFCNLTSWVTRPSHRQKSILLLNPVLKMTDYTIVNQTPAKHIHAFFQKLGFRELERKRKILFPIPELKKSSSEKFRVTFDPEKMASILNPEDATILKDHLPFKCGHLLVYSEKAYCYIVYTRTKGRKVHFSQIHYISNTSLFLKNLNRIKLHLLIANRTLFTMVESRFLGDAPVGRSKEAVWTYPTLFKSNTLQAADIDNLYSELILLNL